MNEEKWLLTVEEMLRVLVQTFGEGLDVEDIGIANILIAKAQLAKDEPMIRKAERERIAKWGNEPCIEHSRVEWPDELGGGIEKRQKMQKRRCQHCWQALKEEGV